MPRPAAILTGSAVLGASVLAGGCAEMAAADAAMTAANYAIAGVYVASDAIHRLTLPQELTPQQRVERAQELLGRMARGQKRLEDLSDEDRLILAQMAAVVNKKKEER